METLEMQVQRVVTVYFDANQPRRFGAMYVTETGAIEAAKVDGIACPAIESRTVALPRSAFWTGDTIAVDLYRGATQNEDGVSSGGRWFEGVVGYAEACMVWADDDGQVTKISGCLRELGSDKHIQSMSLMAGVASYPYRNATLIRARTQMESGNF